MSYQNSQDPPKKQQPKQDSTIVERPADSIYIQQKLAREKLDSIIEKKTKR